MLTLLSHTLYNRGILEAKSPKDSNTT